MVDLLVGYFFVRGLTLLYKMTSRHSSSCPGILSCHIVQFEMGLKPMMMMMMMVIDKRVEPTRNRNKSLGDCSQKGKAAKYVMQSGRAFGINWPNKTVKGKGKARPRTGHEGPEGE